MLVSLLCHGMASIVSSHHHHPSPDAQMVHPLCSISVGAIVHAAGNSGQLLFGGGDGSMGFFTHDNMRVRWAGARELLVFGWCIAFGMLTPSSSARPSLAASGRDIETTFTHWTSAPAKSFATHDHLASDWARTLLTPAACSVPVAGAIPCEMTKRNLHHCT